jgi:hypothetical protein
MDRDGFAAAAIAILRSAVGWQSAIARRLEVSPRQVRRWISDDKVPDWAADRLARLTDAQDMAGPWPRDEWLAGWAVTGESRRGYIVHLMPPRFVARLVHVDETTGQALAAEMPADTLSGVVYQVDPGTVLCEVDWIDEVEPGKMTTLLEAAAGSRHGWPEIPGLTPRAARRTG